MIEKNIRSICLDFERVFDSDFFAVIGELTAYIYQKMEKNSKGEYEQISTNNLCTLFLFQSGKLINCLTYLECH